MQLSQGFGRNLRELSSVSLFMYTFLIYISHFLVQNDNLFIMLISR